MVGALHDHVGQLNDTGQIDYIHDPFERREIRDMSNGRERNYAGSEVGRKIRDKAAVPFVWENWS